MHTGYPDARIARARRTVIVLLPAPPLPKIPKRLASNGKVVLLVLTAFLPSLLMVLSLVIADQHAVQVIYFVLDDSGDESREAIFVTFPFQVATMHDQAGRAGNGKPVIGQTQAPFIHAL
jgi:hypothetical protein